MRDSEAVVRISAWRFAVVVRALRTMRIEARWQATPRETACLREIGRWVDATMHRRADRSRHNVELSRYAAFGQDLLFDTGGST